jgi:hypothetical protein
MHTIVSGGGEERKINNRIRSFVSPETYKEIQTNTDLVEIILAVFLNLTALCN